MINNIDAARIVLPENPSEGKSSRYQLEAVKNRFKAKYYPSHSPEQLNTLVELAMRMALYLMNGTPSAHLKEIFQKLKNKTGKTELTEEEKKGKVFSIALKVVHQVVTFDGELDIPSRIVNEKGEKDAPFTKLFGKAASFKVMKADGSINRRGIIFQKTLGQGTFNSANLVYDLKRGENVMRDLKPELMDNKRVLEDWQNDRDSHKILLDKKIQGIVILRDVFHLDLTQPSGEQTPKVRGMLLEKCDGDLNKLCGKLSLDEQKNIMKQILTTLSQIHAEYMVHGDLKLGNILFVQTKNGIETKVGDFGSVRSATGGWSGTNTPEYVTPLGWSRGNIGTENTMKQDCFALGMIAYELRYGRIALPAVGSYRLHLLENNTLKTLFQQFKSNKIDREQLLEGLNAAYPNTVNFEELLDEDILSENDENQMLEIYDKCYNSIIEYEYQAHWEASMKQILTKLLIMDCDPYNILIARLLDPNNDFRISAEKALKRLNALLESEKSRAH